MSDLQRNKFKTVFAVFLLLFTISSAWFTASLKDHDCCGEDCAVCCVINLSETNLKLLKLVLLFASVTAICQFCSYESLVYKFQINRNNLSLISQKIRINI